jgi:amino acid adenylation domain-containing protein
VSERTLDEDLRAAAALQPDKAAVVASDRSVSFGGLDLAAGRIAAGLRKLGVGPGDRVALVLPNTAEMPEAIYGVLRARGAFTPLNPTIKEHKLAQLLEHVGAAAVICDSERAAMVEAAAATAGGVPVVADLPSFGNTGEPPPPAPLDIDLAAVIYTSGSTGEPKGVTVTQRNMSFVAGSITEYLAMGPEDRILCVLPLSFGYGLYQLLTCVRVGATLVLEPGFAFPGRVVQLLEQEKITGLPGVPTVFGVLTSLQGLADRELPHLRFLTNAGAALPAASIAEVRRTFSGARLYSMYGQTECTRVCYLPPEQLDIRPTSVGVPIPGTEAWVADDEGQVAAADEIGELMVRGSHVMQGYWKDPAGTTERLRTGRWPWDRVLATGDLFRQDSEGYLYFVGRRDDLIKSRGEKVAPREVEEVLHAIEGVREAAVVGAADKLLGQAVHAHVAPESGRRLDGGELRRRCAEALESHKVPQRVIFHTALPRTANGKLDRAALLTDRTG